MTASSWLGVALATAPAWLLAARCIDWLEDRLVARWKARLAAAPYDWQQDETASDFEAVLGVFESGAGGS